MLLVCKYFSRLVISMNSDRQIKGTIFGVGGGVPAACRILVPEPGTESSPLQ